MNYGKNLVLIAALAVGFVSNAYADNLLNTVVFNTGNDANGDNLDDHYQFTGTGSGAYVPTTGLAASYLSNTASGTDSKWISSESTFFPPPNTTAGTSYTYRMTFDLTGYSLSSVGMIGRWLADDYGVSIKVNGVDVGAVYTPAPVPNLFKTWNNFTLSGFIAGLNTVDFTVQNDVNPGLNTRTALRVEFTSATANLIPEPASIALLGMGFAGLGVSMCRKRKA